MVEFWKRTLILPYICLCLVSSILCYEIEKCRIEEPIKFQDNNLREAFLNGYIEANLDFNITKDFAIVKDITFIGAVGSLNRLITNITVKFNKIKSIRIQRILDYRNEHIKDSVLSFCTLSIVENYDGRMAVQRPVENLILRHAEQCMEKQLCNFNPADHRIGDHYFNVKSKGREQPEDHVSQKTVNAFTDLVLTILTNGLAKANKTNLDFPGFNLTLFPISFSSTGGPLNVLSSLKRIEDFTFGFEGNRYIISSTFSLKGGKIQLNNVAVSAPLYSFKDGTLPVNLTQTKLSITIAVDYSSKPCRVKVDEISLLVPAEDVDLSILKIKVWGIEVTNVENILNIANLKTTVVNDIAGEIQKFIKKYVEEQKCEDYRDMLFGLKIRGL